MKCLNVKMFGPFSISNDCLTYPKQGAKEASQLNLLIAYLLLAPKDRVDKSELTNLLWGNDKSQNPVGALRNLVYRARLELIKFLPDTDCECIKFSGGQYYWNTNVPCHVDVLKFNILYEICVDPASDEGLRYKSAFHAMKLSKGRFLEGIEGNAWVDAYRETLLQKYIYCASTVCRHLYAQCQYESLLNVCNSIYSKQRLPLDISFYYMYSLYKLEKYDELGVIYSTVFQMAFSERDPAVREKFKHVLKEAKPLLEDYRNSVHSFEYHLIHSPAPKQAAFLDLPRFKNILMAAIEQKPANSGHSNFLCSIALDRHEEADRKVLMEALKTVLLQVCGPTDFFTLSGHSSYAVLFTSAPLQTVNASLHKAKKAMYKNFNVHLTVDFHPIRHTLAY